MQSVMTGFARKSAQFLDDVGIQVMGSADVVGDAVAQMKEKMDDFALSESDAAVQAAKLKTDFENLRSEVGQMMVPAFVQLVKLSSAFVNDLREMGAVFREESSSNTKLVVAKELLNGVLKQENKQRKDLLKIQKELAAFQLWWGPNVEEKQQAKLNKTLEAKEKILKSIANIEKQDRVERLKGVFSAQASRNKAGKQPANLDDAEKKAEEARVKQNAANAKWLDDQVAMTTDAQLKAISIMNAAKEGRVEITEEEWNERLSIRKAAIATIKTEEEILHSETIALLESKKEQYPNLEKEINQLIEAEGERHKDVMLKQSEEVAEAKIRDAELVKNTALATNGALIAISDAVTARELKNLEERGLGQKEHDKELKKIEEEAESRRRAFALIQKGIAIGEATISAIKGGIGAGADTPGGFLTRSGATVLTLASLLAQVTEIAATPLATGRIGDTKRSRQPDTTLAALGIGETVIPAAQTAMHEDDLTAIRDNTANTARGMSRINGGSTTNVFHGASQEEVQNILVLNDRRGSVGTNKI
jgi:hypothetical protein